MAGTFNIRVYGLRLNEKKEILLSDEFVLNTYMTKFPGGGLNYGEGPADCLMREAIEEFGQEIVLTGHLYTTHYFQPAMFYKNVQLISIYYFFDFKEEIRFKISEKKFDFEPLTEGSQSFRWQALNTLTNNDLSFPVDRYVLQLLKEKYLD